MTPRLRVAIDARPLQPGFREHAGRGIGVYASELVKALARRDDVALTLWFEPAHGVPEGLPASAAHAFYGRLNLPLRDRLAAHLTVRAAATSREFDVFHVLAHGDAPAFPPRGMVVTVHDLILEVLGPLYPGHHRPTFRIARAVERLATTNARTLVADSGVTRDDMVRLHGVEPGRVHVAPLGVDARYRPPDAATIAALRARHGLQHPFVLYVGGIDARKNVPFLLEAFAHARDGRREPLKLVLAGHVQDAPEYPVLRERARALGLDEELRVLGFVPAEELPVLLASARVFAFPSLYEGFGLPPLEAMACGTPVVSSDRGSLAEVLGDAALVAPADDARAFAAALARLIDDESLHAQMRARGQARAASFTWERTAEATVAAYRASLAARSR